jgi:hypothetical protein
MAARGKFGLGRRRWVTFSAAPKRAGALAVVPCLLPGLA